MTKVIELRRGPSHGRHVEVQSWAIAYQVPYINGEGMVASAVYEPKREGDRAVVNTAGEQVWTTDATIPPIAEMPVDPDVDDIEFARTAFTLLGSLSLNQWRHTVWVTGMPMFPVLGRLANSDNGHVWIDVTQNPPRMTVLGHHVIFIGKIGDHVMQLWDERLVDGEFGDAP